MASFDNLFPQISKVTGDQGLNLLINNAGTSTKFTKLNLVKPEQLLSNLTINTIAPIILTKVNIYFNFIKMARISQC